MIEPVYEKGYPSYEAVNRKTTYTKMLNPGKIDNLKKSNWSALYNEYYNFDNRIVKIHKVSNTDYKIKMEKLEGFPLDDWKSVGKLSWKEKVFILHEIASIFINHLQFKSNLLKQGEVFFHSDYALCNIWYCNGVVKLLDPESFKILNISNQIELGSRYFGNYYEALSTFRSAIVENKNE